MKFESDSFNFHGIFWDKGIKKAPRWGLSLEYVKAVNPQACS